jgi:hypothetical protein
MAQVFSDMAQVVPYMAQVVLYTITAQVENRYGYVCGTSGSRSGTDSSRNGRSGSRDEKGDPETTLPEGREGFLICLRSAHVNMYLPLVPINPVGSFTAEFVPNTLSHSNKQAVSWHVHWQKMITLLQNPLIRAVGLS